MDLALGHINFREELRMRNIQEEVLEKRKRIMGEDHLNTLGAGTTFLAWIYHIQGRNTDVVDEEVLDKRRRILEDNHPYTLDTMNNLALTYRSQGRYVEAESSGKCGGERGSKDIGRETSSNTYDHA